MSATVEGIVKITNRASPALREIKTDSTAATRATEKLGNTTETTSKKVRVSSEQMSRALKKAADSGISDVDRLKRSIEVLDKIRANPHIDVDTAAATAKIKVLKSELNSIETRRARSELEGLGLVAEKAAVSLAGKGAAGGGSVGGGAAGGGGSGAGGLAGAAGSGGAGIAAMGAAAALALPAIVSLGGAASALVGSLGMAAGGAGIVGAGVMGAAAVGLGSIAAAAIPATKRIGEAKKAQDAYNKSVQQYGDQSAQAVKAHEAMLAAFKKQPGAQAVLSNVKSLGSDWTKQTRPAQNDFVGSMVAGLETANALLPQFATISNSSMGSATRAVDTLFKRLESKEARGTLQILSQTFSMSIGPFVSAVGNLGTFFGRIARFASPTVVAVFGSFERLTDKLAKGAGSLKGQGVMAAMLGQLGAWVGLLKAAGGLAATFFGAGQQQGKSLVEDITGQLEKWTDWLQDNPDKVQKFFDDTIDAAKDLAGALATIATTLFDISTALIPVLSGASQVVSGLGSGGVGALGLYAGARYLGKKGAGRAIGSALGRGAATEAATGGAAATGAVAATAGVGARAIAKGVGGAALRKLGPLALAFGAWDFATSSGSIANRGGAALNGALLGVPNMMGLKLGQEQLPPSAAARAQEYLRHPGHQNVGSINNQINRLRQTRDQTRYNVDPATGTAVNVGLKLNANARRDIQKEIDQLKPTLDLAVKARAGAQSDDLVSAYSIRSGKEGEGKARAGLLDGLDRRMREMGPKGKAALLKNIAEWSRTLEDGNAKQRNTADKLTNYVEKSFKRMGDNVQVVNGKILTGSQSEWRDIRRALSTEAERAAQEVSKAFTDIQREAVGSLMTMGYSRGEANAMIRAQETGGTKGLTNTQTGISASHGDTGASRASGGTTTKNKAPVRPALGARIPGVGSSDYVALNGNAVGAPGELVVNRHSEFRADQKLGYRGALASIVGGESTPHGLMVSRHALGGRGGGVNQIAGNGLHPAISGAAQSILSKFDGLSITSTTGGKHAKNSNHYLGLAADIGGPPDVMNAAATWIAANMGGSLLEGIHNPNLSIKNGKQVDPGFWGAATWAGHKDHIHLAIADAMTQMVGLAGGAGMMTSGASSAVPALKKRKTKLAGVPGALAQGAMDALVGGMQQRMGGTPSGAAGGGAAGGPSNVRAMVIAGLKLAGIPTTPGNVAAQTRLTMAESGGQNVAQKIHDVNSTNGTGGAKGVAQMIQPTFDAYAVPGHTNIWNTVDNEAASARYQMARYGKLVGHSGYALGGRLPGVMDMGDGGQFTTGGAPQLMRVGERGQRERVTVHRESAGSGFGGDKPITVSIGTIVYRAEGDIKRVVEKELRAVAKAIRNAPIDGEGELD